MVRVECYYVKKIAQAAWSTRRVLKSARDSAPYTRRDHQCQAFLAPLLSERTRCCASFVRGRTHAGDFASAIVDACLAGSASAAIAAASDRTADTAIAAAKPLLKAGAEATLPLPAKTATTSATPNVPPRKRDMLKMPDAFPTSFVATALKTAF